MNSIIDYIWYKLAVLYYRWDTEGTTALCFLAVNECFIFWGLISTIFRWADKNYLLAEYLNSHYHFLFAFLLVFIFNVIRYKNRYWRLRDRWIKEPRNFVFYIKGLLVVAFYLLPPSIFVYQHR